MKSGLTKKAAKPEIADFYNQLRDSAMRAKNVQTRDYLNIIAKGLIDLEKLADQRTAK